MTRKTGLISMALVIGLLLGLSIPAIAISAVDRRQGKRIKALEARADKQSRRINSLVSRVEIIENAPDTTTGLADDVAALKNRVDWHGDDINLLFTRTGSLDSNGVYYGVIRRGQVRLSEGDACANGQPRAAIWNSGDLSC